MFDGPVRHRLAAQLSPGLRVEFSAPCVRRGSALALTCEWDPQRPAALSPAELEAYVQARDEFVGELLADLGECCRALVIE